MKTFKKVEVTEGNRLEIRNQEYPNSPRDDSNLGYFITVDRNYMSPDNHEYFNMVIKATGEEASNQEEHIKLIKERGAELVDDKILAVYPITKYEHSGVAYYLGNKHGFDYSNNGFYIVTEKTAEDIGLKKEDFETCIENELEMYNAYANGSVYEFELFDEKGESVDSCGGFYNIDSVKEQLSDEWNDEDMNDYYIN